MGMLQSVTPRRQKNQAYFTIAKTHFFSESKNMLCTNN